ALGQRDVGKSGVAVVAGPLGLDVADEHDAFDHRQVRPAASGRKARAHAAAPARPASSPSAAATTAIGGLIEGGPLRARAARSGPSIGSPTRPRPPPTMTTSGLKTHATLARPVPAA